MTPEEMLSEPLLSKQEIENMLNDINQSDPLLSKEELEYMMNDINQVWSKKCQSHEITVTVTGNNYELKTEFDAYLITNNIGVLVTHDIWYRVYRYSFDTYEGYCKALEFNFDRTDVNIFAGYSEDLCDNENEQAMFDAAYAYGWE